MTRIIHHDKFQVIPEGVEVPKEPTHPCAESLYDTMRCGLADCKCDALRVKHEQELKVFYSSIIPIREEDQEQIFDIIRHYVWLTHPECKTQDESDKLFNWQPIPDHVYEVEVKMAIKDQRQQHLCKACRIDCLGALGKGKCKAPVTKIAYLINQEEKAIQETAEKEQPKVTIMEPNKEKSIEERALEIFPIQQGFVSFQSDDEMTPDINREARNWYIKGATDQLSISKAIHEKELAEKDKEIQGMSIQIEQSVNEVIELQSQLSAKTILCEKQNKMMKELASMLSLVTQRYGHLGASQVVLQSFEQLTKE